MQPAALEVPKKPNGSEEALMPSTPFELMTQAMRQGITAEQLQILQDMHFKQMAWDAEVEFHEALNRVQIRIPRIVPDLTNPQTSSKYASYAALDRVVRPIYAEEGFSLSFNTADCPRAEHVRVLGYLSRKKHTRTYQLDMPIVTTGIKGAAMMTLTHAEAAANTYGKRYLLCDIFNIPVGPDTDGNITTGELVKALDAIYAADTLDKLQTVSNEAYKAAKGSTEAQKAIIAAKDKRKKELSAATATSGVPLEWGKK